MSHPLFGADPGSWSRDLDIGGETVDCALVCPPGVTPEQLDLSASLFERVSELDVSARAALTAAANTEDVRLYFEHYEDQLNTPASMQDLVARLRLIHIALHCDGTTASAVFDYSLDPKLTQYVLAVSFDASGTISSIAMES